MSQGYGVNVAYYQKLFGTNGHPGIDHPCPIGTPIYNPFFPCRVRSVSLDEQRGKGVVLENSGCRFLLWHFSEVLVDTGLEINGRMVVGLSGSSGISTAPHVHAEKKPTDVFGNYLYPSNGLGGAVDFIQDVVWESQPLSTRPMTQKEVIDLYKLAFYREPTTSADPNNPGEREYWTGRTLSEFLATAIRDRAAFLANA